MSVTSPPPAPVLTEHALLVPFGRFAQQIGLVAALERVPFKMKTIDHSPGDKLAELLTHILAGGMHLKDLEARPHALVRDQAVAHAWGQEGFASASGVSDLLRAASPEVVTVLKQQLREAIEPYRRRLLRDLLPSLLVVDFDLTGLVVSDQATTYEARPVASSEGRAAGGSAVRSGPRRERCGTLRTFPRSLTKRRAWPRSPWIAMARMRSWPA